MLDGDGATGEFEEVSRKQHEDGEERRLRSAEENVLIESLHRHLLIRNRRAPVVVDEQPVSRVLGKSRLGEVLDLLRDAVQYRLIPVALNGISHLGKARPVSLGDLLDFGPRTERVVHAVRRDDTAVVEPHAFGVINDPPLVIGYGLGDLDPDPSGWHRHDEIRAVSWLHVQWKLEETLVARGGEEAAGNPDFPFVQHARSSLRSDGDPNVICTQVVP